MADMLDTLALARDTLLARGGLPPAFIRGDDDPGGEVIVLDRVSDTARAAYGGRATTKFIQVSVYAESLARALELTTTTRIALGHAGFRFLQSRPAPDATGEVSDYTR